MPSDPRLLVPTRALLGEGAMWDARRQAVYWLDIKGRRVHRHDPATGRTDEWTVPFRIMSLAPRVEGGFIAGSDKGLIAINEDFARHAVLADPEADRRGNRFNDGKTDAAGRFWAGTMDDAEEEATGALYRLDADGRCTRIDDGYGVTNGPAFSPDGRTMYHNDSAKQTTYAFDLDADGNARNRRVFARFGEGDGYPDGMTVDAEGHVWIAFWDGWCLRRLSPAGDIVAKVAMPVQRPTCPVFGGAALDRLFVTSARIGLDDADLAGQPDAGGLFVLEPGVSGVAAPAFAG